MSWYYDYYLGTKDKNGKIKPLGPYDAEGKLKPVVSRSRSFASDLYQKFYPIKEDMVTKELRKEFTFKSYDGEEKLDLTYMSYLPAQELGSEDFIKKGYFLIEDVLLYQKWYPDVEDLEIFYDWVTPDVYAAMVEHEKMFGKPGPQKDCEGDEYTPKSASDYMYFAYPNYESEEYETFLIQNAIGIMDRYEEKDEIVVICSQG